MDYFKTSTTYLGVKVNLEFKNGNTTAKINARFSTDNQFVQDAIEADKKLMRRVKIAHVAVINEEEQRVVDSAKGEHPRTVRRPKSPFVKEQAQQLAEVVAKQQEEEKKPEAVSDVKNVNDAIAWFAAKGETDFSDLEALREKYNVTFPKMK